MLFKEVLGLDAIKESLVHSVQSKRVPHAQLFLGNQGGGALALAIAYAQYILCDAPSDVDSCGSCPSCKKFESLAHPDLHFSFPIKLASGIQTSDDVLTLWREQLSEAPYFNAEAWGQKQGGSNKQSIIGVKDSENIVRKIGLKSYEGGYKILIQWLPETMNAAAANKLLKLIEEPPAKTLFLLVSESHENVLPTIVSRTQLIKVPSYPISTITSFLTQHLSCDTTIAEDAAQLAEGDLSVAIQSVGSQEEADFKVDHFIQWMRLCYQRNAAEAVDWVEKIAKANRDEQKSFLLFCLHMFRQCIVGHYTADPSLVRLTQKQRQFLTKFSPFINFKNILPLTEAFEESIYHIERNANPKILFLDLSLKVFAQLKKVT